MSEGKKYGLIIPSKAAKSKAVVNPVSVFGNDDDDDDQEANTSGARFPMKDVKKAEIKRQVQLQMEKALAVDPTVYEYDSVYDDLQAKKAMSDQRLASDVERKSKYIGNLLKAAEQRKRDMERRIEKTVQKERDAEKGLFDDKEAFVTDAYRRKMEQIRQEEERERKQEELEARMDVTKQEDMSAFYRNMLDQTTDVVVKTEPAQNENTASPDEGMSKKRSAVDVPDDEDDDSDDSSSSSSSSTPRKCYTQESTQNRNTGRKGVDHDVASDHSSSESDERNHGRGKYADHHHTKHTGSRGEKHASKAATSEEKQSEKYTRKGRSDSRKDHSDHGHKAESKFHSTQTDRPRSADSKKHDELNRQGTENRTKRKHAGSSEKSTSETESTSRTPAFCANSDSADSKQKQARTEAEQTAVQSKTAKQTVGTAFEDARVRYLARKGKSSVPVICEDSD